MSLGHRPWALVLRLVQTVGPDQDYTQGPLDVPESDPHSFLAKLVLKTEVCLLYYTKKGQQPMHSKTRNSNLCGAEH